MSAEATVHRTPVLTASAITPPRFGRRIGTAGRRAARGAADVFMLGGVVLCVPVVILMIVTPVALLAQALLWIGRLIWPT